MQSSRPFGILFRLTVASALPVMLLAARYLYTGASTYRFLLWNLFLAWIPLLFAYLTLHLRLRRRLAGLWAIAWLLFFPNAPYLITDIMHLHQGDVPVLYDAVMLFTFAMCGVALGFVSLRWMQMGVVRRWGFWAGGFFVLSVLGVAGVGIYIGRYLRWNSWDIVFNPMVVIRDLIPRIANPLHYWQTWAMSLLFIFLLVFLYWLFVVFANLGAVESQQDAVIGY